MLKRFCRTACDGVVRRKSDQEIRNRIARFIGFLKNGKHSLFLWSFSLRTIPEYDRCPSELHSFSLPEVQSWIAYVC